jgi:hypothetical protein
MAGERRNLLNQLLEEYDRINDIYIQQINEQRLLYKEKEQELQLLKKAGLNVQTLKSQREKLIQVLDTIQHDISTLEVSKKKKLNTLSEMIENEYKKFFQVNIENISIITQKLKDTKRKYLLELAEYHALNEKISRTFYELNKRFPLAIQKPDFDADFSAYKGMDKSFRIFEPEVLKAYHHGIVHK